MPSWYMPAALLWVAATGLLIVWRILRRGTLDTPSAILLVGCLLGLTFLGPVLTVWICSAGWAWNAARESGKVVRYLKILVSIGVSEASLGFVQYLVAPAWIPGYDHPAPNMVSGTFINRNHFAGLLEMLIPCCIALAYIAYSRGGTFSYSNLYILAGAFCGIALAISKSRMGIFCFIASVVLLRIVFSMRRTHGTLVSGLSAGVLGICLIGLLWLGIDPIVGRYTEIIKPDARLEDVRLTVYKNTIDMIRHFPLGVGIGNYADAFPPFQTTHNELTFEHAHNDYLETTAEWGVFVAIPFWLAIFALFAGLIRLLMTTESAEVQGILLACIGAISAILLHSLVDFNLQIPSNAIVFFSMSGIGLGILFPQNALHGLDLKLQLKKFRRRDAAELPITGK
jgi:hypothetical protein